jgi:hypothetical protein
MSQPFCTTVPATSYFLGHWRSALNIADFNILSLNKTIPFRTKWSGKDTVQKAKRQNLHHVRLPRCSNTKNMTKKHISNLKRNSVLATHWFSHQSGWWSWNVASKTIVTRVKRQLLPRMVWSPWPRLLRGWASSSESMNRWRKPTGFW